MRGDQIKIKDEYFNYNSNGDGDGNGEDGHPNGDNFYKLNPEICNPCSYDGDGNGEDYHER